MSDDRFDELMRDAARAYHVPPDVEPRLDLMWARIEQAHFGRLARLRRLPFRARTVIGIAAGVLAGVGLGRYSARPPSDGVPAAPVIAAQGEDAEQQALGARAGREASPYLLATTRYLGETAELLSALPGEVRRGAPDAALAMQANELLSTTRLLLDSPAARDPEVRVLLGDLELVLAQIAHLSVRRSPQEVQLITEALEARDVLPRLRTAVADLPPHVGL